MQFLATAPARTPGVGDGEFLGHLGAGGAALALTAIWILGARATGKHKLPSTPAFVIGYLAATCYAAAGGLWAIPADLIGTGLHAIGVGSTAGRLGEVGMGSIAVVATAWVWFGNLNPKVSGLAGILCATVYGGAGGIWEAPADIAASFIPALGA